MSYDEGLAERIHDVLEDRSDVSEKKMFGGLAFLLRGNMCVGVVGDELIVGFVYVGCKGIESDAGLRRWVTRGVDFACSLPAK
jgi:hypothetical protein